MLSKTRTMSSDVVTDKSKVSLFPDFSAELQKQRAKCTDVKKRRELNLQYAMLYPARLPVVVQGEVNFFDCPTSAKQWLNRKERSLREAMTQCLAAT